MSKKPCPDCKGTKRIPQFLPGDSVRCHCVRVGQMVTVPLKKKR